MAEKKKAGSRMGRPPVAAPKKSYMALRFSADELALLRRAAGGYPVATWSRIELLKVAAAVLGKKGGGR